MHKHGCTLYSGSFYDLGNKILFLGRERNFREYMICLAELQAGESGYLFIHYLTGKIGTYET